MTLFARRHFEWPCTVEVEHTADSLHAHVELDYGFDAEPGDEIQLVDAPRFVPLGAKFSVRGKAIVTRASAWERAWTRLVGYLELTELYDVSFSLRRSL